MGFLRKRNKRFSEEDLAYLHELLKTNLPLSAALELILTSRNRELITAIKERLSSGVPVEKALKDHLPESLSAYILSLSRILPFRESLGMSLSFHERQKERRKDILNNITYPCILLFISLSALYLFDMYGLDPIFSLLETFEADLSSYHFLRTLIRIVIRTLYLLVLLGLLLFLYFHLPKRIVFFYVLLSRYYPDSLFHTYYSEEFVSLFAETVRRGYGSKEALEILKSIKTRPIVSFLAFHLDESLLEGRTLKEASDQPFFDPSLSRFIKIASYSEDFVRILDSYTDMAREKIRKRAKLYTTVIQLSSYAFIGLIIIFIYQILFLPMQAISRF